VVLLWAYTKPYSSLLWGYHGFSGRIRITLGAQNNRAFKFGPK